MYQFIRGLSDSKAQERILEASTQVEGGELNLIRVLKLAEAFEMGKTNQQLVNASGQRPGFLSIRTKRKPLDRNLGKQTRNLRILPNAETAVKATIPPVSTIGGRIVPLLIRIALSAKQTATMLVSVEAGPNSLHLLIPISKRPKFAQIFSHRELKTPE